MSVADFDSDITSDELKNNDGFSKRDLVKQYHYLRANLNNPGTCVKFIFGEKNHYYQIGNAFLFTDITLRKSDDAFSINNDAFETGNNAFAYCFELVTL